MYSLRNFPPGSVENVLKQQPMASRSGIFFCVDILKRNVIKFFCCLKVINYSISRYDISTFFKKASALILARKLIVQIQETGLKVAFAPKNQARQQMERSSGLLAFNKIYFRVSVLLQTNNWATEKAPLFLFQLGDKEFPQASALQHRSYHQNCMERSQRQEVQCLAQKTQTIGIF